MADCYNFDCSLRVNESTSFSAASALIAHVGKMKTGLLRH